MLRESFKVVSLSFFCFFFGKWQGKPPKTKKICYPHRTPKIPGKKKGKTLKKTRNSSQGKKNKKFQKHKERKDRVFALRAIFIQQGDF